MITPMRMVVAVRRPKKLPLCFRLTIFVLMLLLLLLLPQLAAVVSIGLNFGWMKKDVLYNNNQTMITLGGDCDILTVLTQRNELLRLNYFARYIRRLHRSRAALAYALFGCHRKPIRCPLCGRAPNKIDRSISGGTSAEKRNRVQLISTKSKHRDCLH